MAKHKKRQKNKIFKIRGNNCYRFKWGKNRARGGLNNRDMVLTIVV